MAAAISKLRTVRTNQTVTIWRSDSGMRVASTQGMEPEKKSTELTETTPAT